MIGWPLSPAWAVACRFVRLRSAGERVAQPVVLGVHSPTDDIHRWPDWTHWAIVLTWGGGRESPTCGGNGSHSTVERAGDLSTRSPPSIEQTLTRSRQRRGLVHRDGRSDAFGDILQRRLLMTLDVMSEWDPSSGAAAAAGAERRDTGWTGLLLLVRRLVRESWRPPEVRARPCPPTRRRVCSRTHPQRKDCRKSDQGYRGGAPRSDDNRENGTHSQPRPQRVPGSKARRRPGDRRGVRRGARRKYQRPRRQGIGELSVSGSRRQSQRRPSRDRWAHPRSPDTPREAPLGASTRVGASPTIRPPERAARPTKRGLAKADNLGWSLYGAPWLQPLAIDGKSTECRTGENKPKPLPSVATGCLRRFW